MHSHRFFKKEKRKGEVREQKKWKKENLSNTEGLKHRVPPSSSCPSPPKIITVKFLYLFLDNAYVSASIHMFYFLTQMGFALCTTVLSVLASVSFVSSIFHVSIYTSTAF